MSSAHAARDAAPKVGPSDCKPRDADSTCATAVAGAPVASPVPIIRNPALYDGPLAGVPANGYAYWGFDFVADATGMSSEVRNDEFINRSNVPVTIRLSFNIPTNHPCGKDCLPGVQFQVDAGWFRVNPPMVVDGDKVSMTETFNPGQGYGWIIGLWQATNPQLTVTIPKNALATMEALGLPTLPGIATEVAAVTSTCTCSDGTIAACSDGTRFSNGLLGPWSRSFGTYARAGAFNNCPTQR